MRLKRNPGSRVYTSEDRGCRTQLVGQYHEFSEEGGAGRRPPGTTNTVSGVRWSDAAHLGHASNHVKLKNVICFPFPTERFAENLSDTNVEQMPMTHLTVKYHKP